MAGVPFVSLLDSEKGGKLFSATKVSKYWSLGLPVSNQTETFGPIMENEP